MNENMILFKSEHLFILKYIPYHGPYFKQIHTYTIIKREKQNNEKNK